MSTFTLGRKTFSEKKKGLSNKEKAAIAGLGTLATAAGGFYGARKGMLGKGLAMSSNEAWARLGAKFGSEGMMKSGAHGYSKARAKRDIDNLIKTTKDLEKLSGGSKKISNLPKDKLKKIKTETTEKLSKEYEKKVLSELNGISNGSKKSPKKEGIVSKVKSIFRKKKK